VGTTFSATPSPATVAVVATPTPTEITLVTASSNTGDDIGDYKVMKYDGPNPIVVNGQTINTGDLYVVDKSGNIVKAAGKIATTDNPAQVQTVLKGALGLPAGAVFLDGDTTKYAVKDSSTGIYTIFNVNDKKEIGLSTSTKSTDVKTTKELTDYLATIEKSAGSPLSAAEKETFTKIFLDSPSTATAAAATGTGVLRAIQVPGSTTAWVVKGVPITAGSEAEAYDKYAATITDAAGKAEAYEKAAAAYAKAKNTAKANEAYSKAAESYLEVYNSGKDTKDLIKSIESYHKAGITAANKEDYKKALEELQHIDISGLSKEEQSKITRGINRMESEVYKEETRHPSEGTIRKAVEPFYNWLNNLQKSFTGFSGTSFFYTDDGFIYDSLDETMQSILKGIPGIASEICKSDVLEDLASDSGFAISESTQGASAHIEGERITMQNLSGASGETFYIYKISFDVNPGTISVGCDIGFSTVLRGPSGETPLIKSNISQGAYSFDVKRGDSSVSYTGANMVVRESAKSYTSACIKFTSIEPRAGKNCLVGVSDGGEICNSIAEGEEKVFTDFSCDYCEKVGSKFAGGGEDRLPTQGSTSSTSDTSQGGPVVGDI